ncbi:MlaD family protein [Gordonia sp. ABSL1-1]|uniref:MlaD family protein n=1 Tax=Gordonia sp. ABSL1-1 TaxID=3053923 RepID=UPI0025734F0A|nr:MlaD family protein [Gordonia sp. ABSL1-1]MDL9938894.1 MlaD family protein [Gordonia sp. ABSL1-1]
MKAARPIVGLVALVAVSVLLTVYLAVGILKIDPLADTDTVTVELDRSGGLQPNSSVLYNGIEVGSVRAIDTSRGGLRVTLEIDADAQIPADATIRVANLSMVGEQYIEFSSTTDGGPYISDGADLGAGADPGVSVAQMLAAMRGLTGQFDPEALNELARTITNGWRGRDADLAIIADFAGRTARTVSTYRTEFAGLFDHVQQLLLHSRDDRIAAVLRDTAPKLAHMNVPFATLWSLLPGLAASTEGAVGWYDVIIPFTQKIGDYLGTLLPDTAAIMAVLQPKLTAVAPAARINLAAIAAQGLRVVDENGVLRLRVAPPR